jgi:hypothetical protein
MESNLSILTITVSQTFETFLLAFATAVTTTIITDTIPAVGEHFFTMVSAVKVENRTIKVNTNEKVTVNHK